MKIIKYEKKRNDKYKVFLENGDVITLYEDVILDNDLLLKKEITSLEEIEISNSYYELYNKCVKYILTRVRSKKEIEDYLNKNSANEKIINKIILKLETNKLIDDEKFTQAFISDKLRFSTMGEKRIERELKRSGIDEEIISKYLSLIDNDVVIEKMNKLINKSIKANKKYQGRELKNKVYTYLINLGYRNDIILEELSKYDF